MSKWADRLALLISPTRPEGTDETDETLVVSVLAVAEGWESREGQTPTIEASKGLLTATARALPDDARKLLDALLWLQGDTGALSAKALALATGWPQGWVLACLDRLQGAGVAIRSGAAWRVSARLARELRQGVSLERRSDA